MKNWHYLIFTIIAVVFSGCYSKYEDARTPEMHKQDLKKSLSVLKGKYIIKDSRNIIKDYFTSVEVYSTDDNAVSISLFGPKNRSYVAVGRNCVGNFHSNGAGANFHCDNINPEANPPFIMPVGWVFFERWNYDYNITSGAMIGGFKAMEVKKGDYVLGLSERTNGRTHYLLLEKQP